MRWSKSLIGMGLSLAQRPQQINCSHCNCNSCQLANSDSESATVLGPRPSWPLWHWHWHWQTRLCPPRLRGAAGLDAWLPAAQADVQASQAAPSWSPLALGTVPPPFASCCAQLPKGFLFLLLLLPAVLHADSNLQLQLISTVGPIDKAMLTLLM